MSSNFLAGRGEFASASQEMAHNPGPIWSNLEGWSSEQAVWKEELGDPKPTPQNVHSEGHTIHLVDDKLESSDIDYRGTSLTRNAHLPRTSRGPWAQAYRGVLE